MKIMLILPPLLVKEEGLYGITPPLGIAYLASVLEKKGHTVHLLDCIIEGYDSPSKNNGFMHLGLGWEEIEQRMRDFSPDLVGISCMFSMMFPEALRMAEIAKGNDRKVPVVMGGAHPSSVPLDVLGHESVDFVVIGEGEETLVELIDALGKNSDFQGIDGLGYRINGSLKVNPKTRFIRDLDALPFPARHLLPMERYHEAGVSHGGLKRSRYASIITSRGCPGNCVYCSIHSVWGKSWRPRSPENVLQEIQHLVTDFGIREIHFEDDNLTFDRERARLIFQGIIDRGWDITWTTPNGVAIWKLDEELLRLMKKSGCYQLNLGIESGNEYVLRKIIRKPLKLEKVREIVGIMRKIGIWIHGFFIIGLPGETKKTIKDTINFAMNLDLDSANFFIATPYVGTELYAICKNNGFIKDYNLRNLMVQSSMISTEDFSSDELIALQKKAYRRFMINKIMREIIPLNILNRLMQIRSKDDIWFMQRKLSRLMKIIK